MTIVLGISSTSHDTSATLFVDGKMVAAISEERLSRIKCDGKGIPQRAIDCVLSLAGYSRQQVDAVALMLGFVPESYVIYPDTFKKLSRSISVIHRQFAGKPERLVELASFLKELPNGVKDIDSIFNKSQFLKHEGFREDANVLLYPHHDVHAALAGHYSGYQECAVVTIDGVGDTDESHYSCVYKNGVADCLAKTTGRGNSAGLFYEAVTRFLGFRPLRHEGKVLGLAAFGDPGVLYEPFRKALRLSDDGMTLVSDFGDDVGGHEAREQYIKQLVDTHTREEVAAAAQKILEDAVVPLVKGFVTKTGYRRIALNGGVFANVKLNQRIAALPEIDEIFVFPAMSDTGNSVGAALLAAKQLSPTVIDDSVPLKDVYLGPSYSDDEIESELKCHKVNFKKLSVDEIIERSAQAINDGLVVGWFQGRMEFGPRALGHRSMIARPINGDINRSLNERLERTEFMPFAPSVLVEAAEEVFFGVKEVRHAAEFMTVTLDVRPEWHSRIPAVVHVDGTARPQFVRRDRNELYHQVISRYYELSGIPLVLNTSFNAHEEPIVCSPGEGIRALVDDRIDVLAIGSFWVTRI